MRCDRDTTTRLVLVAIAAALLAGPAHGVVDEQSGGAPPETVTVTRTGSGGGTITSSPGSIQCGSTCSNVYAQGVTVTLTAVADAGSQFTGWLGPCTGRAVTCQFVVTANTTVNATFAPIAIGPPKLDIDGNDTVDALTDGVMVLRYLFGLDATAIAAGAIAGNATRSTAAQVKSYLDDIQPVLDIDGNGMTDALTDGLMILRYAFGLRQPDLATNALGSGATLTGAQAEARLSKLSTIAVYVSTIGSDGNAGTPQQPFKTIAAGITAATQLEGATVRVAIGSYSAAGLDLAGGVAVRGGFDQATWQAAAAGSTTLTGGLHPGESQYLTVLAKNLAAPAMLSNVTVVGPNALTGKDSVGISVIGSSVLLDRLVINGGSAGSGLNGANGPNAASVVAVASMNGGNGGNAVQQAVVCDATSRGAAGPQGTQTQSSSNGGSGGSGGTMDTNCATSNFNATAGQSGSNAPTTSGSFGVGGPASAATSGLPGTAGQPGVVFNGAAAAGASGLAVVSGYPASPSGVSGGNGGFGGGGGGGGGSGGSDTGTDTYGAGGGGGGAGGAPGSGGSGGAGGGSSVGIWALNSSVVVQQTTVNRGAGGTGGSGGNGGRGQNGGTGGLGGLAAGGSGAGGNGGAGGHGGHGAGGGGGAGGASVAILHRNSTVQSTGNTFAGGSSGNGGPGGASAPGAPQQDGNPGVQGGTGQLAGVLAI